MERRSLRQRGGHPDRMDRLVAIVPVETRDKSDGLEVVVHYEGEATRIFAKAPDLHAVARSVFRAVADGPPSPKKLEN